MPSTRAIYIVVMAIYVYLLNGMNLYCRSLPVANVNGAYYPLHHAMNFSAEDSYLFTCLVCCIFIIYLSFEYIVVNCILLVV